MHNIPFLCNLYVPSISIWQLQHILTYLKSNKKTKTRLPNIRLLGSRVL